MKRRILILSSLLVLVFSLFVGVVTTGSAIDPSGNTQNNLLAADGRKEALDISGDVKLSVGEVLDFSNKFKLNCKGEKREKLTYTVEDEEVIYLNSAKYTVIISSTILRFYSHGTMPWDTYKTRC